MFNIEEDTLFISYKDDKNIDDQGEKIILNLTDNVEVLFATVSEKLGIYDYNLIQVDRLRNGFCQLAYNLNHCDKPESSLKDLKFSHLSTWMVVKNPSLIQKFSGITGELTVPINVKIRHFGNEDAIKVYNNINLEELIQ